MDTKKTQEDEIEVIVSTEPNIILEGPPDEVERMKQAIVDGETYMRRKPKKFVMAPQSKVNALLAAMAAGAKPSETEDPPMAAKLLRGALSRVKRPKNAPERKQGEREMARRLRQLQK